MSKKKCHVGSKELATLRRQIRLHKALPPSPSLSQSIYAPMKKTKIRNVCDGTSTLYLRCKPLISPRMNKTYEKRREFVRCHGKTCGTRKQPRIVESWKGILSEEFLMKCLAEETPFRTNKAYEMRRKTVFGSPILPTHYQKWFKKYGRPPLFIPRRGIRVTVSKEKEKELWGPEVTENVDTISLEIDRKHKTARPISIKTETGNIIFASNHAREITNSGTITNTNIAGDSELLLNIRGSKNFIQNSQNIIDNHNNNNNNGLTGKTKMRKLFDRCGRFFWKGVRVLSPKIFEKKKRTTF